MLKSKILVADDDKDMCWVIKTILRKEGYSVNIAHEGESALNMIKKGKYDMIVLDYKFSRLSGLAVLKKIRQIRPFLQTIMISAFGNESVRLKAKELGAYAFLDKPFDIERLVEIMKNALIERIDLDQKKILK